MAVWMVIVWALLAGAAIGATVALLWMANSHLQAIREMLGQALPRPHPPEGADLEEWQHYEEATAGQLPNQGLLRSLRQELARLRAQINEKGLNG